MTVKPDSTADHSDELPAFGVAAVVDAARDDLESVEKTDSAARTKSGNALVRGSLWTIAGYGAGQVLRLVGNVVVSRFLLPESFGLMALVNVFLQALVMFSDMGVEPSIIQHRRGDEPRFRNTAWTLQVIRGGVLFLAALVLAWPVAMFYAEPRLLTILPVAALSAVIAGFNSTALFTARRHLQLGRLTLLELGSQAVGLIVMIGWAWYQPSVWALVGGSIATSLVVAASSHRLIAGAGNRFDWERESFHDLFHFGKWILVSTLVMFCAMQADRLLLGKLISLDRLGIYSVAVAIATLPNLLLGMLAGAVLYPLLARHGRESSASMIEPLRAARSVLLSIGWLLILGVIAVGPTFFQVIYDQRYAGAGEIARWLAIAVWFFVLSTTAERALPAIGDPRGLATFNLVKLLATVPLVLVGFYAADLTGFILGMAGGAAVAHLWLLWRLQRHGLSLLKQDGLYTLSLAIVATGVILAEPWAEQTIRFGGVILATPWIMLAALYAYRQLLDLRRWSHG
ncbi:MAG: oligosaccharide flippase family protein [Planctomycetaceae bacterium]|nr:oligosaccharide flippase family protein [Planctomycetaceae bacterium]